MADATSDGGAGAPAVEALRAALDPVERALLAQLHFAAGEWTQGLALVEDAAREARGLVLLEARARFGQGQRDAALALLERHAAEHPNDALGLYYQAQLLAQCARPREAIGVLGRCIERMPDLPGALTALAALVFPGPGYREILARLHAALRPRVYLEIGVEHGTTLALAVHSRLALGIDPVARPAARPLPAGARLFHMTSDEFFATHRRQDLLAEDAVQLAFIDGMHWFEYALRDYCNVERWCGPGSVVVLHDCLPVAPVAATRQRHTRFWVGDTWKALECLLAERPDLRISVIPCQPSGLVVIQRPDPAAPLAPRLEALIEHYAPLAYPYAAGELPPHYPLIPSDEASLARLLASLGTEHPA